MLGSRYSDWLGNRVSATSLKEPLVSWVFDEFDENFDADNPVGKVREQFFDRSLPDATGEWHCPAFEVMSELVNGIGYEVAARTGRVSSRRGCPR